MDVALYDRLTEELTAMKALYSTTPENIPTRMEWCKYRRWYCGEKPCPFCWRLSISGMDTFR